MDLFNKLYLFIKKRKNLFCFFLLFLIIFPFVISAYRAPGVLSTGIQSVQSSEINYCKEGDQGWGEWFRDAGEFINSWAWWFITSGPARSTANYMLSKVGLDFQSLIIGIPLMFFGAFALIFGYLAWVLAIFSTSLLSFILHPSFMPLSYTNPANNEIIEAGLNITQGFVNIILVLTLLYIGLVTILGIEKYNTQKLLVTFVGVALLVNFAPVVCGLIVDFANIIMNHFVSEIVGGVEGKGGVGGSVKNAGVLFSLYKDSLPSFPPTDLDEMLGGFIGLVVMVFYFLGVAFVYFIFSFIFVARYFFIWLLVILSPIAFACYVLPELKQKVTDVWWNHFIQWSFIGVTGGFFIYLAEKYAQLAIKDQECFYAPPKIDTDSLESLDVTTFAVGLMSNISFYLFSLFLLGIGLMFTLQTSAIGSQAITRFAKNKALPFMGKGAMKLGKTTGRFVARNTISAENKEKLARMSVIEKPKLGKNVAKNIWGWAQYGAFKTIGAVGTTLEKTEKTEREETKQNADKLNTTEKARDIAGHHSDTTWGGRQKAAAALISAAKSGKLKDLKKKGVTDDMILETIQSMRNDSPEDFKEARKLLPQHAKDLVNDEDEDFEEARTKDPSISKTDFIVGQMDSSDYENLSKEAL